MTSPGEPAGSAARARWRRWLPYLAGAWLLVRLPSLVQDLAQRLPASLEQARAAITHSRAELLQAAIGLSPEMEQLLRERLPEGGRLVVYSPYAGEVAESLVRVQFERLKNLLYPVPRDAAFARSAAELARAIEPRFAHKLVVVDGTQEPVPLPVPGEFELLGTQRLQAMQVRYWLLRRAGG